LQPKAAFNSPWQELEEGARSALYLVVYIYITEIIHKSLKCNFLVQYIYIYSISFLKYLYNPLKMLVERY
jgi:hypothetical protein